MSTVVKWGSLGEIFGKAGAILIPIRPVARAELRREHLYGARAGTILARRTAVRSPLFARLGRPAKLLPENKTLTGVWYACLC
jgi:hypothetical protein